MAVSPVRRRDASCENASIEVSGIKKRFGDVRALNGIDLKVEPGLVFALLGPNGSGKTTLVRIITTLLQPDEGSARIGGYNVVKQPALARTVFGLAGQYPAVDENFTGKENLEMIGRLYHLGKEKARQRAQELLADFDLTDAAKRRVKTYSGGMRRRLDLAAALVASPPILLLDEPTSGLDPRSRLGLWEVIKSQADQCSSVFLTTQYLEEADRLADRIAIMDRGKILREGTPRELKECCGGDTRVQMKLREREQTREAAGKLASMGNSNMAINEELGEISFPATRGAAMLAEVVRQLDKASIELSELGLAQPTLDDVFLSLTGHAAEEAPAEDTAMKNGARP